VTKTLFDRCYLIFTLKKLGFLPLRQGITLRQT
jgi:hypothetical protein